MLQAQVLLIWWKRQICAVELLTLFLTGVYFVFFFNLPTGEGKRSLTYYIHPLEFCRLIEQKGVGIKLA